MVHIFTKVFSRHHKNPTELANELRARFQAYKLNPNHEEMNQNFEGLVRNTEKEDLFEAIIEISKEDMLLALDLAAEGMNKNTYLGCELWRPRGLTPCTLDKGVLSQLKAFYDKNAPYQAAKMFSFCSAQQYSFFSLLPRDVNLLVAGAVAAAASRPTNNQLTFAEAKEIAHASFKPT